MQQHGEETADRHAVNIEGGPERVERILDGEEVGAAGI